MEHIVNETLEYVISLTPHVRNDDVPSAILMLLLELGFRPGSDGFGYLRKAILMYCNDPDMRISGIYQEIARTSRYKVGKNQVEQAILSAIEIAWKNRNVQKWDYFFSEEKMGKNKRPSNKEFISELGCIMELWRNCCKEGCYGIE